MYYIRRFLAAAWVHAHPARQDNAPTRARTHRRWAGPAVGIAALGALVLTGAPAVAAIAPAGAATAQATAGTPQIYWADGVPGTIGREHRRHRCGPEPHRGRLSARRGSGRRGAHLLDERAQ